MGKFILVAAAASGVYGIASGSDKFLWFGLLLVLYAIESSAALALEDMAGHRRRSVALLGWLQLVAIALGVFGLVVPSSFFLPFGVALLVVLVGATVFLLVRGARGREAAFLAQVTEQERPHQ